MRISKSFSLYVLRQIDINRHCPKLSSLITSQQSLIVSDITRLDRYKVMYSKPYQGNISF
ncbi:hypothetical protein C0W66_21685 [Photobacterium kishitanii]|nr:hypothetical protein C0W66_21685 [Photobacterium kishitanii]